ncbi:adenylate/guanylate cyclase domain-containing protein [Solimonas sp. K1W22B-7]|uniref:adenylate/guanylate cyclase domain-containing protein n=1 Tax=Solimonas sp. K1W22B-7 TaxID=2303331 RepID=UPI0013C5176A|nr:adenylate/guanylate cyclase domain-containing protein [Solimonas sp. K1W22B-7]
MPAPQTYYADSGGHDIAWQALGEGAIDVVHLGGITTQIDLLWELPEVERFWRQITHFARLILFDRRGIGASSPVDPAALPSADDWAADLLAVLDAAGSEKAAIFAEREGCAIAIAFAARYPKRVSALILGNATARYLRAPDHPVGEPPERAEQHCAMLRKHWATEGLAATLVPARAGDSHFLASVARLQRAAGTPRVVEAQTRHFLNMDLRDRLPLIRCPTLILHRREYPYMDAAAHARYLEEHIEGSRRVEIDGSESFFAIDRGDEVLGVVEEFLTGGRSRVYADRVLVTVLFLDMVGSTVLATEHGDAAWHDLLSRFHRMVRKQLHRFRGHEVDNAGDGFFATFDSPGRSLLCARAIREEARSLDLGIRVGVHAGECEVVGPSVRGVSVHIGARVMGEADAGEIMVSSTVRALLAGSDFGFRRRGEYRLKGVEGRWRLYALDDAASDE